MSLLAPSITELTTLTAPAALLREWLLSYFDGAAHDVGLHASVAFPKLSARALGFAVSEDPQPMQELAPAAGEFSIRVVIIPRESESWWANDGLNATHKRVHDSVRIYFWVKAQKQGLGQSEKLAAEVAQLLKAILTHPETRYALAERGIHAFEPKLGEPLPEAGCALYLVHCACEFHYPVLVSDVSMEAVAVTVPGSFVGEDPVYAGRYLLGLMQWRAAVVVVRVTAKALAGSSPTVLELEVDGVLTGVQVTLPSGPLDVEVTGLNAAPAYTIPAEGLVRWLCVASANPVEETAIRVSLVMSVE